MTWKVLKQHMFSDGTQLQAGAIITPKEMAAIKDRVSPDADDAYQHEIDAAWGWFCDDLEADGVIARVYDEDAI